MKLLKQTSRTYKEKEYVKHWVVIPNDLVKELNWKDGNELEAEIRNNELVIKKIKK